MIFAIALGLAVALVFAGLIWLPLRAAAESKNPAVQFICGFPVWAFCASIPSFIVVMIMNPPKDEIWSLWLKLDLGMAFVVTLFAVVHDATIKD